MEEYQNRVVKEKKELDEKLDRLKSFLTNYVFESLSAEEQSRLKRQASVMAEYSAILGERIKAWA